MVDKLPQTDKRHFVLLYTQEEVRIWLDRFAEVLGTTAATSSKAKTLPARTAEATASGTSTGGEEKQKKGFFGKKK